MLRSRISIPKAPPSPARNDRRAKRYERHRQSPLARSRERLGRRDLAHQRCEASIRSGEAVDHALHGTAPGLGRAGEIGVVGAASRYLGERVVDEVHGHAAIERATRRERGGGLGGARDHRTPDGCGQRGRGPARIDRAAFQIGGTEAPDGVVGLEHHPEGVELPVAAGALGRRRSDLRLFELALLGEARDRGGHLAVGRGKRRVHVAHHRGVHGEPAGDRRAPGRPSPCEQQRRERQQARAIVRKGNETEPVDVHFARRGDAVDLGRDRRARPGLP